jgi:hypothetical protein
MYFMGTHDELLEHHEEGHATQKAFHQQACKLVDVISNYGNHFLDDCGEFLVLNTRSCVDESVIATFQTIETFGRSQYQLFVKEVLVDRSKPIGAPIKRNSLPLISCPKVKAKTGKNPLFVAKSDANLFGRLYIANQLRTGDPAVFFSHENQLYPPALSEYGKLRKGAKSDLLKCLNLSHERDPPVAFDCKVFDGAALVHMLPPVGTTTFMNYAENVFVSFILRQLSNAQRVDIAWGTYLVHSIKNSTRDMRGNSVRVKIGPQTKVPGKWNDLLKNATNKEELFCFLTDTI